MLDALTTTYLLPKLADDAKWLTFRKLRPLISYNVSSNPGRAGREEIKKSDLIVSVALPTTALQSQIILRIFSRTNPSGVEIYSFLNTLGF